MYCKQCELVRMARIADTCSVCKRDFERPRETRIDSPSLDPKAHLYHEIAEAFKRGAPVGVYEAVPGCPCVRCTGVIPQSSKKVIVGYSNTKPDIPILDLLELLGCRVKKAGKEWKATCPLHDDRTPSMSIDRAKNLWYCFVCAEGGDSIQLWMRAKNLSFQDALNDLNGKKVL